MVREEYVYKKPLESKKLIGILVLIGIVAIASYLIVTFLSVKDCGTYKLGASDNESIQCFMDASVNCNRVKIVLVDAFGSGLDVLTEIKGLDGSYCLVYDKFVKGPSNLVGLEENCRIPMDVFSTGSMSHQQRFDYCSGSLTEWLKTRY